MNKIIWRIMFLFIFPPADVQISCWIQLKIIYSALIHYIVLQDLKVGGGLKNFKNYWTDEKIKLEKEEKRKEEKRREKKRKEQKRTEERRTEEKNRIREE